MMSAIMYMHKQFCRAVHQLTMDEQNAVKSTIVDYMNNPKLPGLHWHRLDKCKDQAFASIRSSRDIRLILHPCLDGEIICYVDHHDAAYAWAEKRALKFDDDTEEVLLYEWPVGNECPFVKEKAERKNPIFRKLSDDDLRWYGVPDEWNPIVREITDADQILDLMEAIPESACEALMTYAEGKRPSIVKNAKRDVIRIENSAQVDKFVDMSWDEWSVYLHPSQEMVVMYDEREDILVTGGPGTGKTVVALHRAARGSRNVSRGIVLLATTSSALASRLRKQIEILSPAAGGYEILTLRNVAQKLSGKSSASVIAKADFEELVRQIASEIFIEDVYGVDELKDEFTEFRECRKISREEYLQYNRTDRTLKLSRSQRSTMFVFMERLSKALEELSLRTEYSYFEEVSKADLTNDYCEIIIDECQNLSDAEWKFVSALKLQSANAAKLSLFGDDNQRISGIHFPDVSKRFELSVNYRSSEMIDRRANAIIGEHGVSGHAMFRGIAPILYQGETEEKEREYVCGTLKKIRDANPTIRNSDIAFFVHNANEMPRAEEMLELAGLPYVCFYDGDEFGDKDIDAVTVATFNQAPGLEFRLVFIVGCQYGVVPPQDIVNCDYERRLLYVVMTRARDALVITGVQLLSEFLTETQQRLTGCEIPLAEYLRTRDNEVVPVKPETISNGADKDASVGSSDEAACRVVVCPFNSETAKKYLHALYHMTGLGNIQSLLTYGLLSKHEIVERGLQYVDISNQDVQSKRECKCDTQYGRNLHDYASLYMNPRNAMLYAVKQKGNPIFMLEIDLSVLDEASFVFTSANAASSGARFYRDINDLDKLKWDIIRSQSWYGKELSWKQQMQAEFLVHPKVLPKYICAVVCRDIESKKALEVNRPISVDIKCDSSLFF